MSDENNKQDTRHHEHSGGGGDDMLQRIKELKKDVSTIKTDVAVIRSNYVTRADLHEEIGKQTKWTAATIIATAGISLAVAKFIF
ncbi:hypothetical protein [Xenorhabdus bovienii]|uniref:hypothetical protein n=1 Tax=Xenorhabdus bovienii TaxID=40576 RepID=UPI0023B34508|nr:hypothetical protein [Xenorhabdus bovienii]